MRLGRRNIPVSFVLAALLMLTLSAAAADIHDAVRAGDPAEIKALLAKDPKVVHEKDGRGRTPLILAREHGYLDIGGILTDEGAEPAAGREAAEKKLPSRVILPENKGDRFRISK